jgi:hypothetical protein
MDAIARGISRSSLAGCARRAGTSRPRESGALRRRTLDRCHRGRGRDDGRLGATMAGRAGELVGDPEVVTSASTRCHGPWPWPSHPHASSAHASATVRVVRLTVINDRPAGCALRSMRVRLVPGGANVRPHHCQLARGRPHSSALLRTQARSRNSRIAATASARNSAPSRMASEDKTGACSRRASD